MLGGLDPPPPFCFSEYGPSILIQLDILNSISYDLCLNHIMYNQIVHLFVYYEIFFSLKT